MTVDSRNEIDALTRVGRVVAMVPGERTTIVTDGQPIVVTTCG